jgi:Mn-dependent DtxR family transcriptional regulator
MISSIFTKNMKEKRAERLESIKEAHKSAKTDFSRIEDYLEVISELVELKGYANTIDISRYLTVSAPSVTKMLQKLAEGGYLEYEKYRGISLTQKGSSLAEAVRQKHGTLLEFFKMLGISHDIANQDVEGIEHHLNPQTIKQLRKFVTFLKSNPKILENFE